MLGDIVHESLQVQWDELYPQHNYCRANAYKIPPFAQIESLVSSRHAAVSFNTSWLEDLYEEHVLELSGDHVTPMVSNPGRIMLTSSRLYYQPYNNVETEPVLKVALDELRSVLKRRYMLRHTVRTVPAYDEVKMYHVTCRICVVTQYV